MLHLSFRLRGDSSRWQGIRQIETRHANSVVGHSVRDVETVSSTRAYSLDSAWIARLVALDARNADPGKIPLRHETWKKIEMSIRSAGGSRIQNALDLLRIAGFRLHQHPQALQLE